MTAVSDDSADGSNETPGLDSGSYAQSFLQAVPSTYTSPYTAITPSQTNQQSSSQTEQPLKSLSRAKLKTSSSELNAFSKLTPELRHLVWKWTLPTSRLIPLYPRSSRANRGFITNIEILITFQICKESRAVAFRHYYLSFRMPGRGLSPREIYFNPRSDILYLLGTTEPETQSPKVAGRRSLQASLLPVHPTSPFQHFTYTFSWIDRVELLKIKKLAVHEDIFIANLSPDLNPQALLSRRLRSFWGYISDWFKNLEELTIGGSEEAMLEQFWKDGDINGGSFDKGEQTKETLAAKSEPEEAEGLRSTSSPTRRFRGSPHTVTGRATTTNPSSSHGSTSDSREETLYDVALRTYWNKRKEEVEWIPPRWRVSSDLN